MKDTQLYSQILGIKKPWKESKVQLSPASDEVQVTVVRDGGKLTCPKCSKTCPGYDHRNRRWRHLDTCQLKTVLLAGDGDRSGGDRYLLNIHTEPETLKAQGEGTDAELEGHGRAMNPGPDRRFCGNAGVVEQTNRRNGIEINSDTLPPQELASGWTSTWPFAGCKPASEITYLPFTVPRMISQRGTMTRHTASSCKLVSEWATRIAAASTTDIGGFQGSVAAVFRSTKSGDVAQFSLSGNLLFEAPRWNRFTPGLA